MLLFYYEDYFSSRKARSLKTLKVFVCLLIMVFRVSIAINSIKKGQFTCNKYTLNTYLYIILTFNIIALYCLSLEHFGEYKLNLVMLAVFLITIRCVDIIGFVDPRKIIFKHLSRCLCWIKFILSDVSFFTDKTVIISAAFTTILLTVGLSIIAYVKPDWINLSVGPILFVLLLGGIIMEITLLIIYRKDYKKINNLFRFMCYFFIAVFMGYILYDTKMLQIRAKQCVKADYIQESLNLFLDIFNIFVRLLALGR